MTMQQLQFNFDNKVNIDNYEHLYFFEDVKGIWGEAKNPNEPKISKEDTKQVRQDI